MASQCHNYLAGLVAEESESDYLREFYLWIKRIGEVSI